MKKPKIRARKMILLHSRAGGYSDYTLQPNATDAKFAKMADECSGRVSLLSKVLVLPGSDAEVEQMVEQVAFDELAYRVGKRSAKRMRRDGSNIWLGYLDGAKRFCRSLAITARSTGAGREEGK